MADKAKLTKEAQKHLSKGNIDKAIEIWLEIAKVSPDGNTFNYIGDLYVKKSDKAAAVQEYHKAAAQYMDEGFSLKALAIHKKVLNINPKDPKALIALGQLNEEKNIVTDAIKYYLAAADVLAKENRKDELIEVFDKVISLAPTNIKLRVMVSELFSKEGFVPEAAKEYCNIANLYLEKNEISNAQEYLTKAIEIMPSNKEVLLALSDLAEKKGDLAGAAEYLQTAIEKVGESSDILIRRAKLLLDAGSFDDAIAALKRAVELEPENVDVKKRLVDVYQQVGDISAAWDEASQLVDDFIASERRDEAIDLLIAFKELDPLENRVKLVTLYKIAGDNDSAFGELYGLHELQAGEGQLEAAISSLREALDIKPGDSNVESRIQELQAKAGGASEPSAADSDIVDTPVATTPGGDGDAPQSPAVEKTLDDALSEADVFMKYSLHADARTLLEEMRVKHPDSVDLRQKLKLVYKESGEVEHAVAECIALNELYKGQGDEDAASAEISAALEINPSDERLAQYAPAAAEPQGEDISAELSEADFYMQQGLITEAADTYRKILAANPGNADVMALLAEVEKELGAAEEAPAPAPAPEPVAAPAPGKVIKPFMGEEAESDGLFDFSSILGDDDDGPAIDDMDEGVLGIFDEFKKGLAAEIADEDAATHYDLGIAYKEMGVVDDAIKEFQVASKDPKFFSQATTMIGICQMATGRYDQAADAFSAAIMKADPSNETWWSLKYDLATAYEMSGKIKEAFEIYRDVYNWDVTFRDVAKKYESLKGQSGGDQTGQSSSSDKQSRVSYI